MVGLPEAKQGAEDPCGLTARFLGDGDGGRHVEIVGERSPDGVDCGDAVIRPPRLEQRRNGTARVYRLQLRSRLDHSHCAALGILLGAGDLSRSGVHQDLCFAIRFPLQSEAGVAAGTFRAYPHPVISCDPWYLWRHRCPRPARIV